VLALGQELPFSMPSLHASGESIFCESLLFVLLVFYCIVSLRRRSLSSVDVLTFVHSVVSFITIELVFPALQEHSQTHAKLISMLVSFHAAFHLLSSVLYLFELARDSKKIICSVETVAKISYFMVEGACFLSLCGQKHACCCVFDS